jgi:hypothetical protein
MVKKRGMMKKEVNKMIGITDAFDCEFYTVCVAASSSSFLLLYYALLTIQCCIQFFIFSTDPDSK